MFVARPYRSEFVEATEREVKEMKLQKTRPLIKMRFTKKRETVPEIRNLIERDGGEGTYPEQKPKNLKTRMFDL